MPKDNVLTLKVPGANLVFTRYLYIKDEVKSVLLISILNKSDDAIFWAYELYYSGFKNELYAFIWQIYYDFFATLNPCFAAYLVKKLGPNKLIDVRFISSIIQNLIIRPYNTDVFLLRIISEQFVSDADAETVTVETLLLNQDYRGLASYILNSKQDKIEIYKVVLNYFKLTKQTRLIKEFKNALVINTVKSETILLANIMSLVNIISLVNVNPIVNVKPIINLYIRVLPEEVIQYETIEASAEIKSYRILRLGCTCKIQNNWANLFEGFRNRSIGNGLKDKYKGWTNQATIQKYNEKWLYHAAFSPIWFDRIKTCKGYIDYENQEVKFISDDWEETFYTQYGYDPDEQSQQTKDNALKHIVENGSNWQQFLAKYKNFGLIDALEEEIDALNDEPLKY